ncbi:MAG: hypothetical protein KC496_10925, partial [Anaerolineae bacterium]|nr:hypothetical protein [Anaerolineae bacterium]
HCDAEKVHMLLDQSTVLEMPKSIHDVRSVCTFFRHPKFGSLVLIGKPGPLIEFITLVVTHSVAPQRFDTIDDALQYLRATDPELEARYLRHRGFQE